MRWLIALLLLTLPVQAETVVLGLSQDEIAITTSFDGSEILIFGAVKRDAPPPPGDLGVIVTVAGPSEPVIVRRKERRYGIWVNVDAVEIEEAPSFYAVASSAPFDDVMNDAADLLHKISIPSMIGEVGTPVPILDAGSFTDSLIRIRERSGQYQLRENAVAVDDQTLFRTRIQLPAALREGDYATRIFLTREGSVIAGYETSIDVRKVGLERTLFQMSRETPLIYGLMSLAIAIAAGWGASAAFSLFRQ